MKKRYLFLFVLMVFTFSIFYHSLQDADNSNQESRWIVRVIVDLVQRFIESPPENLTEICTILVRKAAHVLEFMVQSILIFLVFSTFEGHIKAHIPSVMFLGLFTACTDEAIQLSSEGRAGMIQDVFVDFSGTVLGVCICIFTLYLIRKKHNKIKNS